MSGMGSDRRSPIRRLNWFLLTGMVLLIGIGTLFIYSACSIREGDRLQDLYRMHAGTAALGLAIYLAIACVNYRSLLRLSWLFYVGSLALLVAVLLFGTSQMGARRWVFGIQPSEIAKLAVILLMAWLLGRRGAGRGVGVYCAVLGLMAVPVALVLRQPDLGTAMVFAPIVFSMLFAARVAPRAFWITLAVGAVAAVWVVSIVGLVESRQFSARVEGRLRAATGLNHYQQDRLASFLFPDRDPHGGGWNKRQSEIAVGSGGLWGKGLRKGDQNLLGYLPQCVSANDFIFSVLAEEAGFVGSLVVLALYALVIGTVLAVGIACPDGVGRLICVGVATMLFCHVFVNIAMTVGLLPITGLPLPFVSYGRTCLLTLMMALGVVQSVAIHGRQAAPRF